MRQDMDPAIAGLRVKTPDEVRTILEELRQGLEDLYRDRLKGIFLFGSYARGEPSPGSDLDVLVVLDSVESHSREIQRTSHLRARLSLKHDTTICLVHAEQDEWHAETTPFLANVRRDGRAA